MTRTPVIGHVLVLYEGSQAGSRALLAAARRARELGCDVIVVPARGVFPRRLARRIARRCSVDVQTG